MAGSTGASSEDAPVPLVMRLCRNYRRYVKLVIILIMVQVLYSQVYKRGEYAAALPRPVAKEPRRKIFHQLPIHPDAMYHPFVDIPRLTSARPPLKNITDAPNVNSSIEKVTNNKSVNAVQLVDLDQVMANVTKMFSKPRGLNRTLINEFKNQIAKLNTKRMFTLSQETVKRQEALHFSINRNRNQVISDELFKSLPKKCPFADVPLKRCSVVGNSGILLNSGCGADIDNADYIFRCNAPSMAAEFAVDAGSKNNMTTLNPSIIFKRFHGLHSVKDRKRFTQSVQAQNADILLPLFGAKSGYSTGRHITRILKLAKDPPVKSLIIHPKHFVAVQDFWLGQGFRKRLSSGFYLITTAIGMCDEVNLYGFWPFPVDMKGGHVPYHYHDNEKLTGSVHDFPVEFNTILQLHQDGLINLRVDPCQTEESSHVRSASRL